MKIRVRAALCSWVASMAIASSISSGAIASDLISVESTDQLAARRLWRVCIPLMANDRIVRAELLDDNLYLLTAQNLAYAVHAKTGVIRWTAQAAEPDQSLRGPTHTPQYALFTTPASVKAIDRATGQLASEPRKLRGAIIEISHDVATISIGRANGIRQDDVLSIVRVGDEPDDSSKALARLRVTVVGERHSKGEVIRTSRTTVIEPGMRVGANVSLPLRSIKLPFSATTAAVGDTYHIFVGSANERVYSLDIFETFRNWEATVSGTVTSTPVLVGDELYYGSQGGRVTALILGSARRDEARRKWEFDTEGPIFNSLAVDAEKVYVASSDRQLYALNRKNGQRAWTARFENPPDSSPVLADGRVYLSILDHGLHCLDSNTGKRQWHLPEQARYLARFDKDAYVHSPSTSSIIRIDEVSGKIKSRQSTSADFAISSHADQLIVLGDSCGELVCLRPKSAPPLKPAELAIVLQNDARARELARMSAEQRALAEKKPADDSIRRPDIKFIEDDDYLGSRSTAKPAGGRDLVDVGEKPSSERGKTPAETSKKAEPKEESEDESDADEGEEADSDDDSGDEDSDSDDDDEADSDDDSDDEDSDSDDDDDDSEDDSDDEDD